MNLLSNFPNGKNSNKENHATPEHPVRDGQHYPLDVPDVDERLLWERAEWIHLPEFILHSYVNETLDSVDREIVEGHLSICSYCEEDVRELRALRLEIEAHTSRTTPRAIPDAPPKRERSSSDFWTPALAVAVVVLIGVIVWQNTRLARESVVARREPSPAPPVRFEPSPRPTSTVVASAPEPVLLAQDVPASPTPTPERVATVAPSPRPTPVPSIAQLVSTPRPRPLPPVPTVSRLPFPDLSALQLSVTVLRSIDDPETSSERVKRTVRSMGRAQPVC